MWQCSKCSEALEDTFDACWNCGTSKDGTENPDFPAEIDVAESDTAGKTSRRWNGFWAGAVVTAVVGYIDHLIPYLITMPNSPWIRINLIGILVGTAFLSLISAAAGGLAGWIGAKTDRRIIAASKGALILLPMELFLVILTGGLGPVLRLPLPRIVAGLMNFAAIGAIAAIVGRIVGRPREGTETTEEPIQYSLSDILFITTLFGVLLASLAYLSR